MIWIYTSNLKYTYLIRPENVRLEKRRNFPLNCGRNFSDQKLPALCTITISSVSKPPSIPTLPIDSARHTIIVMAVPDRRGARESDRSIDAMIQTHSGPRWIPKQERARRLVRPGNLWSMEVYLAVVRRAEVPRHKHTYRIARRVGQTALVVSSTGSPLFPYRFAVATVISQD